MGYKKYVLWVEDDAEYNLAYLASPLIMSGRYDLTLAVTITEAVHFLEERPPYDAIVFDLRVPAGHAPKWRKIERKLNRTADNAHLGYHLLLHLLGLPHPLHKKYGLNKDKTHGILNTVDGNDTDSAVDGIGIMSIDDRKSVANNLESIVLDDKTTAIAAENFDNLKTLVNDGRRYVQKQVGMDHLALLKLVQRITQNKAKTTEGL